MSQTQAPVSAELAALAARLRATRGSKDQEEAGRQAAGERDAAEHHARGREAGRRLALDHHNPVVLANAADFDATYAGRRWFADEPRDVAVARRIGFLWSDVPTATPEDRASGDYLRGFVAGMAEVWAEVQALL